MSNLKKPHQRPRGKSGANPVKSPAHSGIAGLTKYTTAPSNPTLAANPANPDADDLVTLVVRVPWSVKRATRDMARVRGETVSAYVLGCLERDQSAAAALSTLSVWARVVSWCGSVLGTKR
jgi:hypothetical protein